MLERGLVGIGVEPLFRVEARLSSPSSAASPRTGWHDARVRSWVLVFQIEPWPNLGLSRKRTTDRKVSSSWAGILLYSPIPSSPTPPRLHPDREGTHTHN